ncbi:AAA family ATPase [Streptomyces sp. NPDC056568]|uniref:AAA family ATPase n=1 Tax=Streptomyces sp. NPDC056568 TaxID=3345866 RepID=UPI0036B91AE5
MGAAGDPSLRPLVPGGPVRGREREIGELKGLLARKRGGLVVVCGTGGLGKTTLAARTARDAGAAGRAVFWVRWPDDPSRLAQDLTAIAQALGTAEPLLQDTQAAVSPWWTRSGSTRLRCAAG